MNKPKTKIIVTLGPSTKEENDLQRLKDREVDFVRVNMSHSSLEDLSYFLKLAKKVGIPFIIDTEGSQIRSGDLAEDNLYIPENKTIQIHAEPIIGDVEKICLRPGIVVQQLEPGDLIYIDFDTLILRVTDTSTLASGFITAKALAGGSLGRNKGVIVDSSLGKKLDLPTLSPKDYQSIELGLQEGVEHIAASFMRSGESVEEVRIATQNKMKIISKIECLDSLKNLDSIIEKSDYLLIDRGDLSKEIPIEKIPLTQKIILAKAKERNKGVFVATNLLETMVGKKKPTRAEAHDVIATILDGASGVALSAETAIGKYPLECVNMMHKLINQASLIESDGLLEKPSSQILNRLNPEKYWFEGSASYLNDPHGGVLVDRTTTKNYSKDYLASLPGILLSNELQMDVEQIGIGTYSPLEGFMLEKDFLSVLNSMRIANGVIWPLPIILGVSQELANQLTEGGDVSLLDAKGEVISILHLEQKYTFSWQNTCLKLYGTIDQEHPGVRMIKDTPPVLLGGKITLLRRRNSPTSSYELTPRQARRIFDERGWKRVVGFHTRNVLHRSHEYIQMKALEDSRSDGLFVHPVVGKKKIGDFNAEYIMKAYEIMSELFYPENKVVLGAFATYSRYAGPREAVFTALCRKNFGCTHFIVGRDHTGVGTFYHPQASHDIFDSLPNLGISIIKFDEIIYSKKYNSHLSDRESSDHSEEEKLRLSGTEARKMLERNVAPPEWFMRKEISQMLIEALQKGEEVFVKEKYELKNSGKVIWFTGLSGSGKTTLAGLLQKSLEASGKKVKAIDGDEIRNTVAKNLGFTREDIRTNNRLIAELAKKEGVIHDYVLVSVISPFAEDRRLARSIVGDNFLEVYVNCPLQKCMDRDPKGIYKKALAGEREKLIGMPDALPYEIPTSSEIEVKTAESGIYQNLGIILDFLNSKSY
ncbi:MAG: sulfate adenylyltransferase [bacterium]|nr:sulfate adenylyltransferase [bacterium]